MENRLNLLSTRAGFNVALGHFKLVNTIAAQVTQGYNLADIINNALNQGNLRRYQVRAIVNALLVDKFMYAYQARSLDKNIEDVSKATERLAQWNNLQIVIAYHNPQTELILINPKNNEHWIEALPLAQYELVVIYLNTFSESTNVVKQAAIEDVLSILYNQQVSPKKIYIDSERRPRPVVAPVPVAKDKSVDRVADAPVQTGRKPVPGDSGTRRVTPRYSVLVTNELFHNGNVEAWKKIIESYKLKYIGIDVLIWYDNERINDLNTLFKWGKVKNGTPIIFSVAGDVIKGVSKLQRYLFEGASPRFEVFLKGGIGQVLDLF